jgi:ribosomal protein L3 glutamine methyltransferase
VADTEPRVCVRVDELVEEIYERFSSARIWCGHGTADPWDEAAALVLAVTGLPDEAASLAEPVVATALRRIEELAEQRIRGRMPLAYLLGRTTFCGVTFQVEPGVLIPRSPIGPLLGAGDLDPWLRDPPSRILDLCCGGGSLGILAGLHYPASRIVLADIDDRACALASRNILAHGLGDRAEVVRSDLFEAIAVARFDLILCNPPYVNARDMSDLPPEYAHEPATALAAGADGLDVIARVLDALDHWLTPYGLFVGEVGNSAPALIERYPRMPFVWLDLPAGGSGVFMLDGPQVYSHTGARAG